MQLKLPKRQERDYNRIPRSLQQVIPVRRVYDDGIFEISRGVFSKSFRFTDINYATASIEDKKTMFFGYKDVINSFDSAATTQITINNRKLNRIDFEKSILLKLMDNDLDKYRNEYNEMLLDKATTTNSIVQDKYITVTVERKNIEEARSYFSRASADLTAQLARLGSRCYELDAVDRLRILHDFFRTGEEEQYHIDLNDMRMKGHSFKDYISPDCFEFKDDYFKMGDRYGKVIFLRDYASFIRDDIVAELTSLNRNMMLSISVLPIPNDEAVRET